MQSAAVNDADTAMHMPALLEESFHAENRITGGESVQVEPAGSRVLPAFQLAQFAPVDACRDEAGLSTVVLLAHHRR